QVQSELIMKLEKKFGMKMSSQREILRHKEKKGFQHYRKFWMRHKSRFNKLASKSEIKLLDDDSSVLKIKLYLVKQLNKINGFMNQKLIDNSHLHQIRIR